MQRPGTAHTWPQTAKTRAQCRHAGRSHARMRSAGSEVRGELRENKKRAWSISAAHGAASPLVRPSFERDPSSFLGKRPAGRAPGREGSLKLKLWGDELRHAFLR